MRELEGKILLNSSIAKDIYQMDIQADIEACIPGQFVHLRVPNALHLILRRPISIYNLHNQVISLIYQVAGAGTGYLSRLGAGTFITLHGPVGRGFQIGKAKKIYLVGGGVGIAPLHFASRHWEDIDITAFVGYRDKQHAYGLDDFHKRCRIHIASEDGSIGHKGFVTDALRLALAQEQERPDLILACGPTPMLKALREFGMPCQVSLEARMGCAVGACLTCNCAIRNQDGHKQYQRVCVDGPVFTLEEVDFDG